MQSQVLAPPIGYFCPTAALYALCRCVWLESDQVNLPSAVALIIGKAINQRIFGPRTPEVNNFQSFSRLYGEVMLPFVSCLWSLSRAHPIAILLAFGSAVENVLLQATPQSGFSAFGVNLMEKPAEMACEQRTHMMMLTAGARATSS